MFLFFSKTLVHPASASKSGFAKKILESIKDKENLHSTKLSKTVDDNMKHSQEQSREVTCQPSVKVSCQPTEEVRSQNSECPVITVNVEKGGKKRKSAEPNPPAKKKSKTEPKSCRRKLLPQVKGQQQLSTFFRV